MLSRHYNIRFEEVNFECLGLLQDHYFDVLKTLLSLNELLKMMS